MAFAWLRASRLLFFSLLRYRIFIITPALVSTATWFVVALLVSFHHRPSYRFALKKYSTGNALRAPPFFLAGPGRVFIVAAKSDIGSEKLGARFELPSAVLYILKIILYVLFG